MNFMTNNSQETAPQAKAYNEYKRAFRASLVFAVIFLILTLFTYSGVQWGTNDLYPCLITGALFIASLYGMVSSGKAIASIKKGRK